MVVMQARSKRKSTGGRYKDCLTKRMSFKGSEPSLTKVAEKKVRKRSMKGGDVRVGLYSDNVANVFDKKSKKYVKSKIRTIVESPSNRHYVRRNILTKGAVIDTELGKAKVTSRPGQDGTINAVLI